MPTHKVILSDAVKEVRETLAGGEVSEEVGFWHFSRTIELPFRPYRGLTLATDRAGQEGEVIFRIRRLVWDVRGLWFAYGELGLAVPHESTAERLKELFPEWEMEWFDDHSFDEEGNLVPREVDP
jgi:hypothetical protein